MKKSLVIVSLVIVFLVFGLIFGATYEAFSNLTASSIKCVSSNSYKSPEHTTEELYQDIFMTLLIPIIQRSTDNYYKDFLTISPTIAPWDVVILKANRIGDYRSFDFLLKIELHPYVGPHLDVGLDYITIRINPVINVKVEKYEHVKSYKLPPYYKNVIKKSLP